MYLGFRAVCCLISTTQGPFHDGYIAEWKQSGIPVLDTCTSEQAEKAQNAYMLFFISSFSVPQLIASNRPQMIECVPAGWFCSALEPPRAACGTEASAYSSCPKHGHWLRPASFVLFTISNDLLTVSQSLDVRLNLLFDLFIFISYLFIFFLIPYSWDIWKCVLRVRPVLIS